eukprot:CAMPEP_0114262940 /NCGR_PEP_ID=MMETSP0058-20121206/22155_1 /TAXON_ID=36894 /ORGANISM="Pyramimonas parkeae, CCMP726" /LENGTH=233 /DNA_ID=CAMNT_0001379009 /DNA_START=232 /DNA_END=933 /DNA_ORIENTATION=+
MNMRTVCILKPSVYSKTNAPSLVAGERMALRRSICKGGLHKSTMGKPGREHDLRFRNGSRSASVCLCDMSDNQQKTRREDLAKPFIPLTAKVIPNVPFVKVDVVKQNDKAGPMQVVGTLDIGNYDEEEVYQLLTDHINSHRIFRTILDVQQTQNADGSISLVQVDALRVALTHVPHRLGQVTALAHQDARPGGAVCTAQSLSTTNYNTTQQRFFHKNQPKSDVSIAAANCMCA